MPDSAANLTIEHRRTFRHACNDWSRGMPLIIAKKVTSVYRVGPAGHEKNGKARV